MLKILQSSIARATRSKLSAVTPVTRILNAAPSRKNYSSTATDATTFTTTATPHSTVYSSTVDEHEVRKFSEMAYDWWNPNGKFKPLHAMNPLRILYIRRALTALYNLDPNTAKPLKGLKILDIGCGGGLSSESLARLGATVVGVDASPTNIKIASLHTSRDPQIRDNITYIASTAEDLVHEYANENGFDAVVALEIIEHVADVHAFVKACETMVKPGGALFLSTINRTARAYLTTIIGAEYILGWVPKGTHEWRKFLSPEELTLLLTDSNNESQQQFAVREILGMDYNPLRNQFGFSEDVSTNYILFAQRTDGQKSD